MTTVYLFPGQGSQFVGMGQAMYDSIPAARDAFDQADQALGFDLTQLCFEGPEEALNDTYNTQPAILATSIAALRALEAQGLESPAYVAGHSLGEFSALVAAEALTYEDGLRLVRRRGQLMKAAGEQSPGGMAAILALKRDQVDQLCEAVRQETGQYVGVANDNCPGQVVISGELDALERAVEDAKAQGARRAIPLAVSIAAHSPMMGEASQAFQEALDETPIHPPTIPIIPNATATPLSDPDEIRDALKCQLTSPVRWTESMAWIIDQGGSRFVEIGPKNVLSGLMRRIDRKVERLTTEEALEAE